MTTVATTNPLAAALGYADRGWSVIPLHTVRDGRCSCGKAKCDSPGKHPHTTHGLKDASTDEQIIRRWWKRWPDANVGVVTGGCSGIVAIDIDPRHGGEDSLADLERDHGELPETVEALTGGGGRHVIFAHPGNGLVIPNSSGKLGPGIDVRGDGGYIVVPPSLHASGTRYAWEQSHHSKETDLAPMPPWLSELVRENRQAAGPVSDNGQASAVSEGERNVHLTSLGGSMRRRGMSEAAIRAALREENRQSCQPPLDDAEVDRIAASVSKYDPADDQGSLGLIRRLAEAILADDYFAIDAGSALYHFNAGVYKPKGELRVKRRVKRILAKWDLSAKWSTHRASEVVAYIAVDSPTLWERPPLDTINVLNGLLDVHVNTRELRPHDPAFLSPVQLPVEYKPDATCPAWDQFVSETFPKDAQAVAFEIPAHLMTPDTSKQKAVLTVGEGANGKGVYLAAVTSFVGRRNISAVSLHRLESDKFASARLVGKLANICSDLPSEHLAGTSVFKGLTGADVMLAERKFAESFEFVPFARLIFSANHPPRSADASHAFFRRWLVIPFPRTFEPDEQTPRDELDAKLADPAELSGVLNKALDALPRLRGEGFTEAPSMREAWDEFRQTTDPLTVWLERSTVQTSDAIVPKDDLRKAYRFHANDKGYPTVTAHAMTKAIKRFYPDVAEDQRTVRGRVVWCWIGIGWAAKEQEQ